MVIKPTTNGQKDKSLSKLKLPKYSGQIENQQNQQAVISWSCVVHRNNIYNSLGVGMWR